MTLRVALSSGSYAATAKLLPKKQCGFLPSPIPGASRLRVRGARHTAGVTQYGFDELSSPLRMAQARVALPAKGDVRRLTDAVDANS
jgi:hypothetical protein